ncbi:putative folate/biopterin transporter [Leptomonas pyrrhocoris]|uniref:Putative folate/biopterin transporter n=1 Tax=Leptomonas pyrrhocoris TaxID=157538 RepID=A0A0M9FWF9_LEPPY|nr:putative folate/biopterin transporter [Leptomonas pyrrhocoris]KPA77357.1 putative folate/biopterin transporter [Leptomonas pyrrhocoris]|eukprot:XP_015655796.1 putative folate/biopterin transporter [Leptomonas pyrrhocoris]
MADPHDNDDDVCEEEAPRRPSLLDVREEDATKSCALRTDSPRAFPAVHPDAAALAARHPWTEHIPLFSASSRGLGPKGAIALGLCYFLNKGLGSYLVNYARYAMFRNRYGVDGTRYQRLSTLYTMGWSVKAFSASVSDTFALFGYTKRWYSAGSCVLGAAFVLAFGLLPAKEASANTGAGFMFLTNFCMANIDILSEGHYSRILSKRPAAGPALVSWIWVFIFSASLISAVIQGPVSDQHNPQVGLFISAGAQVVTVVFFIFNWYGERLNKIERYEDFRVAEAARKALLSSTSYGSEPAVGVDVKNLHPELSSDAERNIPTADAAVEALSDELVAVRAADVDEESDEDEALRAFSSSPYMSTFCCGAVEVNKEVFFRNWRLFVYSAIMVSCVVVQCLVTVFGNSHDLGWSSLAVAVTCCSVAFWACTFVAAKAIVFVFLDMLLYLQLPGVMDSFYMATEKCYPEGPHFSYTFYNTIGSIISNFAGIAGVTAFTYVFSKHSYYLVFIVTTVLKVVGSIFDIIIVERWNLYIGIPDHAMYIMGDSIVFQVCKELAWMPVVLLFSRICPRGSESMIYALAAGFSNMGQSMSSTIGSLFIELVWPVKTTGVNGCDFHNVQMLLLVAHILITLAVIPLSFLLLPRARICDAIDVDGHASRQPPKEAGTSGEASARSRDDEGRAEQPRPDERRA